MDSYTTLDLGVSYEVIRNVRLYCRVDNVLDTSYDAIHGFGSPGRTFTFGVGSSLKLGKEGEPEGLAAEIAIASERATLSEAQHAVFLDGIQDAGNVGALLRSAAAFGADTAVLGPGCADPWSPKVLRAAMGGHFALRIAEVPDLVRALSDYRGTLACAVSSGGVTPAHADLTGRLGWIFGAEGQGVSAAASALASLRISIPLALGAESLNVAAAAAILLYERARQLSTSGARS
jgi:TrmH family RNA methyltransferase